MEVTTQRDLIRAVAARWRRQYEPFINDGPMFSWRTGTSSPALNKKEVAEMLDALDVDNATPQDVADIIGNSSWTRMTCNECRKEIDAILTVGEPQDYESRTASLCFDCVKMAADLITRPKS